MKANRSINCPSNRTDRCWHNGKTWRQSRFCCCCRCCCCILWARRRRDVSAVFPYELSIMTDDSKARALFITNPSRCAIPHDRAAPRCNCRRCSLNGYSILDRFFFFFFFLQWFLASQRWNAFSASTRFCALHTIFYPFLFPIFSSSSSSLLSFYTFLFQLFRE